jgi:hypothetical protein
MIIPQLLQYIYGYRYNPNVAGEFSDKINVIRKNLNEGYLVVNDNYSFYKILENKSNIKVVNDFSEISDTSQIAILGTSAPPENYALSRIITSPKKDNSDIIYLYTVKEGE